MANTSPLQPQQNVFLEQMRDQMRRMLVRLEEIRALTSQASGAWMPAVDILEMEDSILIKIETPGVTIENVRATVLDHVLKIEGRKERENLNEKSPSESERPIRFLCLERSYGSFAFTIALRWQVDASAVSAKLNDGVLIIHLPKTQTAGREITIPIKE
jgi:HSP20 family protein